jgi:putative membrane protein
MDNTVHQRLINPRPGLGDHLATARSILANERTFLAYQRTALTELAVAATFIHFFDHPALTVVGWLLVPASLVTMALGIVRYRRMRGLIHLLETQARQRQTQQPPAQE